MLQAIYGSFFMDRGILWSAHPSFHGLMVHPLAEMHFLQRFSNDPTSLLIVVIGMASNSSRMKSASCSTPQGPFFLTRLSSILQSCSIGFRSQLKAGQSVGSVRTRLRDRNSCDPQCARALSCISTDLSERAVTTCRACKFGFSTSC